MLTEMVVFNLRVFCMGDDCKYIFHYKYMSIWEKSQAPYINAYYQQDLKSIYR